MFPDFPFDNMPNCGLRYAVFTRQLALVLFTILIRTSNLNHLVFGEFGFVVFFTASCLWNERNIICYRTAYMLPSLSATNSGNRTGDNVIFIGQRDYITTISAALSYLNDEFIGESRVISLFAVLKYIFICTSVTAWMYVKKIVEQLTEVFDPFNLFFFPIIIRNNFNNRQARLNIYAGKFSNPPMNRIVLPFIERITDMKAEPRLWIVGFSYITNTAISWIGKYVNISLFHGGIISQDQICANGVL